MSISSKSPSILLLVLLLVNGMAIGQDKIFRVFSTECTNSWNDLAFECIGVKLKGVEGLVVPLHCLQDCKVIQLESLKPKKKGARRVFSHPFRPIVKYNFEKGFAIINKQDPFRESFSDISDKRFGYSLKSEDLLQFPMGVGVVKGIENKKGNLKLEGERRTAELVDYKNRCMPGMADSTLIVYEKVSAEGDLGTPVLDPSKNVIGYVLAYQNSEYDLGVVISQQDLVTVTDPLSLAQDRTSSLNDYVALKVPRKCPNIYLSTYPEKAINTGKVGDYFSKIEPQQAAEHLIGVLRYEYECEEKCKKLYYNHFGYHSSTWFGDQDTDPYMMNNHEVLHDFIKFWFEIAFNDQTKARRDSFKIAANELILQFHNKKQDDFTRKVLITNQIDVEYIERLKQFYLVKPNYSTYLLEIRELLGREEYIKANRRKNQIYRSYPIYDSIAVISNLIRDSANLFIDRSIEQALMLRDSVHVIEAINSLKKPVRVDNILGLDHQGLKELLIELNELYDQTKKNEEEETIADLTKRYKDADEWVNTLFSDKYEEYAARNGKTLDFNSEGKFEGLTGEDLVIKLDVKGTKMGTIDVAENVQSSNFPIGAYQSKYINDFYRDVIVAGFSEIAMQPGLDVYPDSVFIKVIGMADGHGYGDRKLKYRKEFGKLDKKFSDQNEKLAYVRAYYGRNLLQKSGLPMFAGNKRYTLDYETTDKKGPAFRRITMIINIKGIRARAWEDLPDKVKNRLLAADSE